MEPHDATAPRTIPQTTPSTVAELAALQPLMDGLHAKLLAERVARKALIPAAAIQTAYEQYESAKHMLMFEKIGLRLAIEDGDGPCAAQHKEDLLKAASEMDRLEKVVANCRADLERALAAGGFTSLEDAQAALLSTEDRTRYTQTLLAFNEAVGKLSPNDA